MCRGTQAFLQEALSESALGKVVPSREGGVGRDRGEGGTACAELKDREGEVATQEGGSCRGAGDRAVRGGVHEVRAGQCEESEKPRTVEEVATLAWRRPLKRRWTGTPIPGLSTSRN